MDWTENCHTCVKHRHLINQEIEFCLEEGQIVIDYPMEVKQYEQTIPETDME